MMKKLFSMFSLGVLISLVCSCEQEKDSIQPVNEKDHSEQTHVPHFDENNSELVDWEDLPSELREATVIKSNKEEFLNATARTSSSRFSYLFGPWGGSSSNPSFYIAGPNYGRIYAIAIAINSSDEIIQFRIWYMRDDGSLYFGGSPGGDGGKYYFHYFDHDEYIRVISGVSGNKINKLGFYTNKKSFSYGRNEGVPFHAEVPPNYQIMGFWGKAGEYIDQLGFYVYTQ